MNRVDLFTTIHKGLRALLFEAALEAARVDLSATCEVDALAGRIERMLGFLDEHARLEDAEIVPALRLVDPVLAATLAAEHCTHPSVHAAVERATRALTLAPEGERGIAGKHLMRVVNQLVSMQLLHMNHEETVVNAVLWGAFGDAELLAMRGRSLERLSEHRHAEWCAVLVPVVDPTERRVLG
jgi:hypothetical protein